MSISRLLAVAFALVGLAAGSAQAALPPGSMPLPPTGSLLYMKSEPGDYVGGAPEQLYTAADSSIAGSISTDGRTFSASVNQANFTHWWYVYIQAPVGQQLAVGAYENAQRWPFQADDRPGLSIFGDGRGCNTLTGRFDVTALDRAPTGELIRFEADFEQHCEGGPAALFGRIRIENPPPPPDTTAPTLFLPGDLMSEAPDTNGTAVWWSVSATDDRDPSPVVACDPESGSHFSVGATQVTCTATDSSGNVATGSFRVTVFAPLAISVAVGSASVDKAGNALITGTVTCSRPLQLTVGGQLRQLFANRVWIVGSYFAMIDCDGTGTWRAAVSGDNGRFAPGKATAYANVVGCHISCVSGETTAELLMKRK
jgi:hypothetical protein